MKNMKKLVSLLLAVCLMASLAIGASAAEPTTVDVSGGTGTSENRGACKERDHKSSSKE